MNLGKVKLHGYFRSSATWRVRIALAICEYLEERVPEPALLGATAAERARIRAFVLAIACEIHPLQNLRVLNAIAGLSGGADGSAHWAHRINQQGMEGCNALLSGSGGPFCFGESPSLADVFLIPQMANARRYGVDIIWDRLAKIEANCLAYPAFASTAPSQQPDFTP